MTLAYDSTGSGPAIVFLHAALGDRRMWHPQWEHFSTTNTVVRLDLRGFGESSPSSEPFSASDDVVQVLDELGVDHATIVGASMGGRIALQLGVTQKTRVNGLLLFGAARSGHSWSQQVQDFWAIEEAALDAGNVDAAVEANLDFWLDGPSRSRDALSNTDRVLVALMQRTTFENELGNPDAAHEDRLADLHARLGEIQVPTTVAYGTDDAQDIAEIAAYIADHVPGASLHPIEHTAHLPSLERPAECNQLLTELLAKTAAS